MPRSPIDLPRMQNQPRLRMQVARRPKPVAPIAPAIPVAPRKPLLMRQYELIDRVKQYNPKADEDLLNRAYVYAMRAHGEQKRESGDPYFSHPLQVAGILTDLKLDDATIAAALLHDTIEDTDATRTEIDRRFKLSRCQRDRNSRRSERGDGRARRWSTRKTIPQEACDCVVFRRIWHINASVLSFTKSESMLSYLDGQKRRLPPQNGEKPSAHNLKLELRSGEKFFIPIPRNPLKSPNSKK